MASVKQSINLSANNKNAKYRIKYVLKQTLVNGTIKYTYTRVIEPIKKYSYSV